MNEKWLADITHIDTDEGWLYLAALLDAHSRKNIVRKAAFWITLHMLGTGITAVLLGVLPELSILYWLPATLATAEMLRRCLRLIRQPVSSQARLLFIGSNFYLMLIVLLICVDTLITPFA